MNTLVTYSSGQPAGTRQILLSVWWLHHLRCGLVEWLWRSLSYGQRPPMRYPPADTNGCGRLASLRAVRAVLGIGGTRLSS